MHYTGFFLLLTNGCVALRPNSIEEDTAIPHRNGFSEFKFGHMSNTPGLETLTYEALMKQSGGTLGNWNDAEIHKELLSVMRKIDEAPIIYYPFPRIEIDNLFSKEFYDGLMKELPNKDQYTEQVYAGTQSHYDLIELSEPLNPLEAVVVPTTCCDKGSACGKKCYYRTALLHDENSNKGQTLFANKIPERFPLWIQAFRLVHSQNFTQTLVRKFQLPAGEGMEAWKREHIQGKNIRNSAALRIEPEHYHLTPHVDMWEKLVTWQFFHPENDELADRGVGTTFWVPKTDVNLTINTKENPHWLPYERFDAAHEVKVLPNYFFAFAPSTKSWHGAVIEPDQMQGVNKDARRTFLGFITTEEDHWHHFGRDDTVTRDFYV